MAKKLLGSRGFTLVEIMVALGVMSIGALGVMQMAQVQTNIQVKSKAMLGTAQVVNIIQRHISKFEACERTFSGMGAIGELTTVNTIASVRAGNNIATIGQPLYPNDPARPAELNSIIINDIKVVNFIRGAADPAGNTVESFSLRVDIQRIGGIGNGVGAGGIGEVRQVTLPFPVQIKRDGGGAYLECVTEGEIARDTALLELCTLMGDDPVAFDASNLTCGLVNYGPPSSRPLNDTTLTSVDYLWAKFDAFITGTMDTTYIQDGSNVTAPAITQNVIFDATGRLQKRSSTLGASDAVTVGDINRNRIGGVRCSGGANVSFIPQNGTINCRNLVCPAEEYLKGFDSSGDPVCVRLLGSASYNCANDGTLQINATGEVIMVCN